REVEKESLAQDQVVFERKLDEHRKFSALTIRRYAEPIAGHGHADGAPADQLVAIARVAIKGDIVIGKRGEEALQDALVLRSPTRLRSEGGRLKQHIRVKDLERSRNVLSAFRNRQRLGELEHSFAIHVDLPYGTYILPVYNIHHVCYMMLEGVRSSGKLPRMRAKEPPKSRREE